MNTTNSTAYNYALFASSYYTVQRTCQTRLFAPKLAAFTFWGWQRVIVLAAITLPLGYTRSKEYAEVATQMAKDPHAPTMGGRLFASHCPTCHGSAAPRIKRLRQERQRLYFARPSVAPSSAATSHSRHSGLSFLAEWTANCGPQAKQQECALQFARQFA